LGASSFGAAPAAHAGAASTDGVSACAAGCYGGDGVDGCGVVQAGKTTPTAPTTASVHAHAIAARAAFEAARTACNAFRRKPLACSGSLADTAFIDKPNALVDTARRTA
jgi:hypothetical protein